MPWGKDHGCRTEQGLQFSGALSWEESVLAKPKQLVTTFWLCVLTNWNCQNSILRKQKNKNQWYNSTTMECQFSITNLSIAVRIIHYDLEVLKVLLELSCMCSKANIGKNQRVPEEEVLCGENLKLWS